MISVTARIEGPLEEAFKKRVALGCGKAGIVREALIVFLDVDTRRRSDDRAS